MALGRTVQVSVGKFEGTERAEEQVITSWLWKKMRLAMSYGAYRKVRHISLILKINAYWAWIEKSLRNFLQWLIIIKGFSITTNIEILICWIRRYQWYRTHKNIHLILHDLSMTKYFEANASCSHSDAFLAVNNNAKSNEWFLKFSMSASPWNPSSFIDEYAFELFPVIVYVMFCWSCLLRHEMKVYFHFSSHVKRCS